MVKTSKKRTLFQHPLVKDLYVDKIPGGTSPFFEQPFVSYFTPIVLHGTIADLGCGKGINGFLIRLSRYLEGAKIIGVEINKDYINFCNKHNLYDEIIKKPLPNLSF